MRCMQPLREVAEVGHHCLQSLVKTKRWCGGPLLLCNSFPWPKQSGHHSQHGTTHHLYWAKEVHDNDESGSQSISKHQRTSNPTTFSPGMTPVLRPDISRCFCLWPRCYTAVQQSWPAVETSYICIKVTHRNTVCQDRKEGLVATWAANISLHILLVHIISKNTSHGVHSSYVSVQTLSTLLLCRNQAATIVT